MSEPTGRTVLAYNVITSDGDVIGSADSIDHAVQICAGAWMSGRPALQVVDAATSATVYAWIGLAQSASDSGTLAPPEEYT